MAIVRGAPQIAPARIIKKNGATARGHKYRNLGDGPTIGHNIYVSTLHSILLLLPLHTTIAPPPLCPIGMSLVQSLAVLAAVGLAAPIPASTAPSFPSTNLKLPPGGSQVSTRPCYDHTTTILRPYYDHTTTITDTNGVSTLLVLLCTLFHYFSVVT